MATQLVNHKIGIFSFYFPTIFSYCFKFHRSEIILSIKVRIRRMANGDMVLGLSNLVPAGADNLNSNCCLVKGFAEDL